MTADLDRLTLVPDLVPNRLESADQLALLGIDADHRLTQLERRTYSLADVRKLRVISDAAPYGSS